MQMATAQLRNAENSEDDDYEDDADDFQSVELGKNTVSIRTSSLEEKSTACTMLCCYVEELRGGFFPYVEEVTKVMVPLLTFPLHEEVGACYVVSLIVILASYRNQCVACCNNTCDGDSAAY